MFIHCDKIVITLLLVCECDPPCGVKKSLQVLEREILRDLKFGPCGASAILRDRRERLLRKSIGVAAPVILRDYVYKVSAFKPGVIVKFLPKSR